MIKKYWAELLLAFIVLSMGILLGAGIKNIEHINEIKHLENEVVESYDKGYSDGANDALFELMEDYYDVVIENAILKERLDNQPSNREVYERIVDDFEMTIELMQHYYENNITSHSFGDWLQINYPALYDRLLDYF